MITFAKRRLHYGLFESGWVSQTLPKYNLCLAGDQKPRKQNSNLREPGGFDMYYDSELEMVLIDVNSL